MTLRLPPEIEDQLKQVAEVEHRSVQQTVLVAIEEYLSMRETAEILADPAALRGLAEAREVWRRPTDGGRVDVDAVAQPCPQVLRVAIFAE